MNHDDTNLPSDANPGVRSALDPALEARIVAWVAGEASAFEQAELERLAAGNPELAAFKREMESVHALAADAARPDPEPWRMAEERRAKLLRTLGATPAEIAPDSAPVVPLPSPTPARRGRWKAPQLYFIASGLAAACLLGFLVMPEMVRQDASSMTFELVAGQSSAEASQTLRRNLPVEGAGRKNAREELDRKAETPVRSLAMPAVQEAPAAAVPLSRPAPAPETVYKLDAFTVTASSDRGYGAAAGAASAPKPVAPPPAEFTRDLADALKPKASGTKEAAAGGTIVSDLSFKSRIDERAALSQPTTPVVLGGTEKKSGRTDADGAPAADRVQLVIGSDDKPLARSSPPPTDAAQALRAEVAASAQPASTFSLHVSDVSFRLAQAALARGEWPEADRIRPEEFYNAFSYGDPVPTMAEKVGARIEQSAHPFLQQRNLLRIAVRVPATGRGAAQPLRLTVLLDTSGSMEREDRVAIVRRALQELAGLLGPADRVTLVGFARTPRLIAESIPGDQATTLADQAARLPAEGGTHLESALQLAGDLARRQRTAGAQNRIVLLTDGAANLGNANPDQLAQAIDGFRQQGIAFDACGIGLDGLDDAVLEALTRRGDGRYTVLNSPDEAGAGFARKLAGAFRPAAEDVKLQVRFNPARVGLYRLIGFERHRLAAEDFRNDRVDAAELAAGEAAVAVYQFEARPEGSGEVGEVSVRFRDAASGQMVERTWALPYEERAPSFDRAAPALQLAGSAALLAEKLRGGPAAEAIRLRDLAPVVNGLRGAYSHEPRVQEFVTMFGQVRRRLGD